MGRVPLADETRLPCRAPLLSRTGHPRHLYHEVRLPYARPSAALLPARPSNQNHGALLPCPVLMTSPNEAAREGSVRHIDLKGPSSTDPFHQLCTSFVLSNLIEGNMTEGLGLSHPFHQPSYLSILVGRADAQLAGPRLGTCHGALHPHTFHPTLFLRTDPAHRLCPRSRLSFQSTVSHTVPAQILCPESARCGRQVRTRKIKHGASASPVIVELVRRDRPIWCSRRGASL